MARRTATAALAGIGSRWHQRRDVHPTGRVPPHSMPQPCTAFWVAPWAGSHRSFRHRHTLRRLPWGIGRPGPRAEALRLCRLRSLAVATPESSAPTSGIATRPLRLHACPPDAALRLPSLSLSLHCRWRAVLLAHSLTLMPTRAFHSDDAMLLVRHRQSTRATSAAERCSALRASRRCLSVDAGASSGAGSLMPHRHPFPRPGHRCRSRHHIAARRPRRCASECELLISTARNLPVRADHPHSHPSAMTASPIASLKTHTAFLHGHAGLPQLIIAPTSYAATHGCRESVAHDMTQPCTSFRVAPCLYGSYRSIRLWRTLTSGRRSSCGIRTACYSLRSGR